MYYARILTFGALFAVFLATPMPADQGIFDIQNPAGYPTYTRMSTISPAGNTDIGVNVNVKLILGTTIHDEESIDVDENDTDWTVSSGQFAPPTPNGWTESECWKCKLYKTEMLVLKDTHEFKVEDEEMP